MTSTHVRIFALVLPLAAACGGDDEGGLDIPASMFVEEDQEIEISRTNEIDLHGGAPGSYLSVERGDKTHLSVVNPYDGG